MTITKGAEAVAAVDSSTKTVRTPVVLFFGTSLTAGYGLDPEPEYRATMRAFNRVIGLARLKVFHLNDSLKPHGSRVDRHAHIGRGHVGLEPFRRIVNDPRFRNRPMVLETPKENDMDAVNLKTLRDLVRP